MPRKILPKNNPYFVELDSNGCRECHRGRTYHVIGPDGIAGSTSYEDSDDAAAEAEILNNAYASGRSSVSVTRGKQMKTDNPVNPSTAPGGAQGSGERLKWTIAKLKDIVTAVGQGSAFNGLTDVAVAFACMLDVYAAPNANNPEGMCDDPLEFRKHFAGLIVAAGIQSHGKRRASRKGAQGQKGKNA